MQPGTNPWVVGFKVLKAVYDWATDDELLYKCGRCGLYFRKIRW